MNILWSSASYVLPRLSSGVLQTRLSHLGRRRNAVRDVACCCCIPRHWHDDLVGSWFDVVVSLQTGLGRPEEGVLQQGRPVDRGNRGPWTGRRVITEEVPLRVIAYHLQQTAVVLSTANTDDAERYLVSSQPHACIAERCRVRG